MNLTFLPRDSSGLAFDSNCALAEDINGKLHAIIRHVAPALPNPTRPVSSIVCQPLCELARGFNGPRSSIVQCDNRTSLLYHYEDPRLVRRKDGGFYMTVCSWGGQYFEDTVNFHTAGHQMLFELDQSFKVQKEHHPVYAHNGVNHFSNLQHEKNWLPFLYDEQLYMIYRVAPHTVFREIDEYSIEEYITPGAPSWSYGTPSGGSAPLPFDDHHSLVFFHSFTTKGVIRTYYVGAYLMENKPPFKIIRSSRTPLAAGDQERTGGQEFQVQMSYFLGSTAPSSHKHHHAVLFPCGAVRRRDTWLVGTGINDIAAGILSFTTEEIEASL